jgi:hypothetical protein
MRKTDWIEVDWEMWAGVALVVVLLIIAVLVAFALARIAPVA